MSVMTAACRVTLQTASIGEVSQAHVMLMDFQQGNFLIGEVCQEVCQEACPDQEEVCLGIDWKNVLFIPVSYS